MQHLRILMSEIFLWPSTFSLSSASTLKTTQDGQGVYIYFFPLFYYHKGAKMCKERRQIMVSYRQSSHHSYLTYACSLLFITWLD